MQIIECYSICVWDGGSNTNHKYYVSNLVTAKEWKNLNTYDEYYKKKFVILDSMDEIANYEKEKLRESARSKLTAEERKALGI